MMDTTELYILILVWLKGILTLSQDHRQQSSFKLGMIELTELCILVPVWKTLTFIQGHSQMKKHKLLGSFACKFFCWFQWNLVYWYDLLVCWNSSYIFVIQITTVGMSVIEFNIGDYIRCTCNTGLCPDIFEMISMFFGTYCDDWHH